MAKESFPLSGVYGLLEPGPVVLVTTAGRERPNIMTLSWHMMIDFEPPIVGCVISSRNLSFELLTTAKECAINIPTVELLDKVVGCGNVSGRSVDKFRDLAFTAERASRIRAPLIEECFANLECKLVDEKMIDKYNLFILEVLSAWIDPTKPDPRTIHHRGRGSFMIAGETIRRPSMMK